MLISALDIQGLKAAGDWSGTGLGASVELPAPPVGMAISDALAMIEAILNPDQFVALSHRLGILSPEHEVFHDDAGFVEQAVELDVAAVDAILSADGSRRVTLTATLELDPPLFGRLREESMRDPRVMTALGQNPALTLKVGWLFSMSRQAVSVGVLDFQVGNTPFALNKSDRPSWMNGMLRAIGARLGRADWSEEISAVTRRLQQASLSADVHQRRGFRRVAEALSAKPFQLGHLDLIGMGDDVVAAFGPELTRARLLGPRASRALRLTEAALVRSPDVLVVEEATVDEVAWLVSCIEGEDATLEQVWVVAAK